MSASLIPYWEAWLSDEITIPVTLDGYVINYTVVNMNTKEGIGDWVCCNSEKKLYSFIKYVLLPSIEVTKYIGVLENEIYLDVSSYEETIQILEDVEYDKKEDAISEYEACFDQLDRLEKRNASLEEIKELLEYINYTSDYKEGIYVSIQLYKNIKSVGKELINEYEKQEMLDELEDTFEMKKQGIEELFDSIEENEFMLKKITVLLNSKLII